jgi:hypothetical protein
VDCQCLAKSLVNDLDSAILGVGPKVVMLDKRKIPRNSETGRYIQLANDFLVLAEKELSAFIRAVQKLFGAEQARQSALHWIEELERMDWPSGESIPDWRRATVVASARLALWGPAIPIGVGKGFAPEGGDSCEHTTRNEGSRKDGAGHDGTSIKNKGPSVVGR